MCLKSLLVEFFQAISKSSTRIHLLMCMVYLYTKTLITNVSDQVKELVTS